MKTAPRISRAMICLAMIWLTMASVPVWGAVHSIEIHETAGAATRNYPVQIGRPFLAGEIAHYPLALVNGTPVATQTDTMLHTGAAGVFVGGDGNDVALEHLQVLVPR